MHQKQVSLICPIFKAGSLALAHVPSGKIGQIRLTPFW